MPAKSKLEQLFPMRFPEVTLQWQFSPSLTPIYLCGNRRRVAGFAVPAEYPFNHMLATVAVPANAGADSGGFSQAFHLLPGHGFNGVDFSHFVFLFQTVRINVIIPIKAIPATIICKLLIALHNLNTCHLPFPAENASVSMTDTYVAACQNCAAPWPTHATPRNRLEADHRA